jgi:hypothetical protein
MALSRILDHVRTELNSETAFRVLHNGLRIPGHQYNIIDIDCQRDGLCDHLELHEERETNKPLTWYKTRPVATFF